LTGEGNPMNSLPLKLRQRLAMLSLRAQLMMIAVGLSLTAMSVVVPLSLSSLRSQTETESVRWALALARMAAHAASVPLADGDFGALDEALQEVVALPGVESVQVVRPGGALAMRVERRPDGRIVSIRRRDGSTLPTPSEGHRLSGDRLEAVASLLTANRGGDGQAVDYPQFAREGWVGVEFSFAERMSAARHNWLVTSTGTLLLVLLALAAFVLFLRRTVQPIRALARYASTMAEAPGDTLQLRWGSQEVRELGRALNWSSQELASRIAETRKRLSRMKAVLDTAADAIVGIGSEGQIVGANPAAERMFGFDEKDLIGRPLEGVLPGMDAARLRQTMADGMLIHSTQSRIGRVEMDAVRHGGTSFPVEVLLGEIPDDPEIRYTCIVRDLTDMRLAEEYLTLYGRVLDCTPNGISVSDARRYPQPIVHINPAFTRITGYAPHEILGRDAGLLEGPLTDPDDLALLARTVQSGAEVKVTMRNYRKDGTVFHNKLSVSPVRDGKGEITHYINVIEDVTAQVEVKQRLIERTARLNATFDLSPDGFAVFDAKGELITSNPALRAMVGDVSSWMPLPSFDQWMQELCDEPEHYGPIANDAGDGKRLTLVLARPSRKVLEREVRRHLGGTGETFVYFRDVTQQFEVDRMKSEFLATAAHELRTPLASILGFTELMIHRRYSEEKQKDLLQTVHRQGTLLSNLIQELLDLSRIESRQGKDFHIVPTPLTVIVKAAVGGITHQELGREVTLADLPDVQVMADASKIEQALTNLLSNAFKYSPGGARVSMEVLLRERQGEAHAVICVHDRGIGMNPSQLARAFERFYRADASGNIPGTGLGLNLVKEIAEIHGGAIELASEPGAGTTASLWLKLARTTVAPKETEPA
jgi:PAS domain S-box-containing protein